MAESSPYDTVEGLRPGCNPPAQAAANRRLPMTGHGSTTQTRSNAQLLPSTTRHVIPHRDKEARSHKHTGRKRKEKHTCNFQNKNDRGISDLLHWFDYNRMPLCLTSSSSKQSHLWKETVFLAHTYYRLLMISDFFCLCLAKGAGGEKLQLGWSTGAAEVGSKRRDTDVFCRCLLNFYESPGRTLTNQSWLLVEERHHTHRK